MKSFIARGNCQLRQETKSRLLKAPNINQELKLIPDKEVETNQSLATLSQLFPFWHSDFVNHPKQPNRSYQHLNIQIFPTPPSPKDEVTFIHIIT